MTKQDENIVFFLSKKHIRFYPNSNGLYNIRELYTTILDALNLKSNIVIGNILHWEEDVKRNYSSVIEVNNVLYGNYEFTQAFVDEVQANLMDMFDRIRFNAQIQR